MKMPEVKKIAKVLITCPDKAKTTLMEQIINVPAGMARARPQELNIDNLTDDDIEALHELDPFLYYSIPGIRQARVSLADRDDLNFDVLRRSNTVVKRKSRVSFECHIDVLLEELLFGHDDEHNDDFRVPRRAGVNGVNVNSQ